MSRDARDPSELSVGDGIARYLRRRRADSTESSVEAWKYRLKLFREWAEEAQIESVNELRGYDFDDYYEYRASTVAPVTLEGEMWTLRMFVEYWSGSTPSRAGSTSRCVSPISIPTSGRATPRLTEPGARLAGVLPQLRRRAREATARVPRTCVVHRRSAGSPSRARCP